MTLDSHHRIDMQRYYLGYVTSNFPDTLHVFQGSSDCWIVSLGTEKFRVLFVVSTV